MPIEIRELVVRVILEEHNSKASIDTNDLKKIKEALVRECTEKVLRKLDNLSER